MIQREKHSNTTTGSQAKQEIEALSNKRNYQIFGLPPLTTSLNDDSIDITCLAIGAGSKPALPLTDTESTSLSGNRWRGGVRVGGDSELLHTVEKAEVLSQVEGIYTARLDKLPGNQ